MLKHTTSFTFYLHNTLKYVFLLRIYDDYLLSHLNLNILIGDLSDDYVLPATSLTFNSSNNSTQCLNFDIVDD